MYSTFSIKASLATTLFCMDLPQTPQTPLAEGQSRKMCLTNSTSDLQNRHKGSNSIPLLIRFSVVGKMLRQARHKIFFNRARHMHPPNHLPQNLQPQIIRALTSLCLLYIFLNVIGTTNRELPLGGSPPNHQVTLAVFTKRDT